MTNEFLIWLHSLNSHGKLNPRQVEIKYLEYNYPIETEILRFISQHPGTNKMTVMKKMKTTSRQKTTWDKINKLVDNGYIEVKRSPIGTPSRVYNQYGLYAKSETLSLFVDVQTKK